VSATRKETAAPTAIGNGGKTLGEHEPDNGTRKPDRRASLNLLPIWSDGYFQGWLSLVEAAALAFSEAGERP
jgi:hypothetical protein